MTTFTVRTVFSHGTTVAHYDDLKQARGHAAYCISSNRKFGIKMHAWGLGARGEICYQGVELHGVYVTIARYEDGVQVPFAEDKAARWADYSSEAN